MKLVLGVATLLFSMSALASGTFVPVPLAGDMVHDDVRGMIYISAQSEIQRYQVASGTLMPPIDIGWSIRGIDISPDSRFLVAADDGYNPAGICVHIVNLDSLAKQDECTSPTEAGETGTKYVAYGSDGKIYVTTTAFNLPEAPLRRFDPVSRTWDTLAQVTPDFPLAQSGDGTAIGFVANRDVAAPEWGFFDVPTGGLVRRSLTQASRASDVAMDQFGAKFAVAGVNTIYVYDDAYSLTGTLSVPYWGCMAYHPVEELLYVCPESGSIVAIANTATLGSAGTIAFDLPWVDGIRLSRDGSTVIALSNNGVSYVQQYAPLMAAPVTATANINQAKAFALAGSIGNGGSIRYSIASMPAHGTVSISGVVATYTPAAGYVGSDAFSYRAGYGRASRTAAVSMNVIDPNRAPIAKDDAAQTRNTAIQIPVLANDSDPDGDVISIVSVTAPSAGTAVIQGTKVLFTPPKQWPKAFVTFSYTIRDARGKTASAQVTVTRN